MHIVNIAVIDHAEFKEDHGKECSLADIDKRVTSPISVLHD